MKSRPPPRRCPPRPTRSWRSAERLAEMAVSLDALVARFKTTGNTGSSVQPVTAERRGFDAGSDRSRRIAA